MGFEVDAVDEVAQVAEVMERLGKARAVGEEITPELERHPLLEPGVDVAVDHADNTVDEDDPDAQAHGEHDEVVG